MSNTYQVTEVTVTLPALGSVIRDSRGNEGKRGAKCRVHLFAVHPDWREKGATFEGYMVGRTVFEGYSKSPFNRTLRIMMPDGYKLVALRVDERDEPESWDSLPVYFTGGYVAAQKAEEVDISMPAPSPFAVDKGKVFINSAVIGDGVSTANWGVKVNADESGTQHAAGMSVGVRPEQVAFHAAEDDGLKRARIADVVSRYLTGEYAEYQQEMVDELIAVFDSCLASNANGRHSVDNLQQKIQQAATDAIRNALKPGGLLFGKR